MTAHRLSFAVVAAVALLFAEPLAHAQINEPADNDLRGRLGVGLSADLARGLELSMSQEFRTDNNFTSYDRFVTSAALTYKPLQYFKIGAGYTLFSINDGIDETSGERVWLFKHRVSLDLSGLYKVGEWHFSLRERFQTTIRTDDFNHYQEPVADLILRTRARVSYKSRRVPLEPYISVEPYVRLNAVDPSSLATSELEAGTMRTKYSKAGLSRVRSILGLTWDINSRNSFDFYFMGDAWFETKIDAKKNGVIKTVMVKDGDDYVSRQAIYYRHGFNSILGVSYNYSF